MRKKKPMLVIAFDTTTDALVFENVCTLGRLIPLPAQIRAGCGLAFCASVEFEKEITLLLQTHRIEFFNAKILEIYV